MTGSRAIDAGDPSDCLTLDQRGFDRPFDGDGVGGARCDVGTVEYTDCNANNIDDGSETNPGIVTIGQGAVPGLAIPDCDGTNDITVRDSFGVGTGCGPIVDLNVEVQITHTWVGDLVVKLRHEESATQAVLMSPIGLAETNPNCSGRESGTNGSDDVNVIFDDASISSIEDAATASGTFRPDSGSLSIFNGLDKCATWTLTISDGESADSGTLDAWTL